MRALNPRESLLLGVCFAVVFLVANGFAARYLAKNLRGSGDEIRQLRSAISDQQMWLEDTERAEARERWLHETMPRLEGSAVGREQGDLLQSMQDELLTRKLQIEQQSLQDIVQAADYTEVSVRLSVRGEEAAMLEWLASLQAPEKFVVIKSLELRLDTQSREAVPQAVCQITVARWFRPPGELYTGSPTP
jgi:hypothetical protein